MRSLSKNAKILSAVTPTAGVAAQTEIEGTIVDMLGIYGLLVLIRMGVIAATAVTSIKLEHGDAANLSDAADVEGSSQSIADDDDGEIFALDVSRVTKRYMRVIVTRGTADATVASGEYVQYDPAKGPITQAAGTTINQINWAQTGTA